VIIICGLCDGWGPALIVGVGIQIRLGGRVWFPAAEGMEIAGRLSGVLWGTAWAVEEACEWIPRDNVGGT
jgi:hypothetical protein